MYIHQDNTSQHTYNDIDRYSTKMAETGFITFIKIYMEDNTSQHTYNDIDRDALKMVDTNDIRTL